MLGLLVRSNFSKLPAKVARAWQNVGVRRCTLLVCTVLMTGVGAHAQTFDWRPVNSQSAALLRAGRFGDAAPIIDRALESCPKAVSSIEAGLCTAIFQENRSRVLEHAGDYAAAEAAFYVEWNVKQFGPATAKLRV